jgi:hypothetical protein
LLVECSTDAPFEVACADDDSAPVTGRLLFGYLACLRADTSAQIVAKSFRRHGTPTHRSPRVVGSRRRTVHD